MSIIIDEVKNLNIDSKDICDFYKKYWKNGTALALPSFYQWQFTASPSDVGEDHTIVAIDDALGRVAGAIGINTRPFYLNGSKKMGAELTTWVVDENYQGEGIGIKMLRKLQSSYDVLVAMGISEMALPIYLLSGFRYIRAIPRYMKVFNFDSIEPYAKYNSAWVKKVLRKWKELGTNIAFQTEVINEDQIGQLMEIMHNQFNFFSRDYKFLEWRYFKHPVFNYKQYLVKTGGNKKGKGVYVCIREETSVKNLRILHVLDFFGDQNDMPAAISFVQDYCIKNNFHLVDFYCTSTEISRYFIASGFLSINDDTYFQFPHLFHPIEMRTPPTTSFIYWSKENFSEIANISKLYITKQDVDLDRPTFHTYEKLNFKEEKLQ